MVISDVKRTLIGYHGAVDRWGVCMAPSSQSKPWSTQTVVGVCPGVQMACENPTADIWNKMHVQT